MSEERELPLQFPPQYRDWQKIRERVMQVAEQKPAYFDSEFVRGMREHSLDDEWWFELRKKDYYPLTFPAEKCQPGVVIEGGKRRYEVVRPFESLPLETKETTVLLVRNDKQELKILKRLPPDELIDFFLNAKELEENGIRVCPNARILRLDNPWVDTVEYDFVPGIDAHQYLLYKDSPFSREERREVILEYFESVIVPLAQGRLLRNDRAYLPGDFNLGSVIVSSPESDNPTFSLVDLMDTIQEVPVVEERILFTRQRLERHTKMLIESLVDFG